jgi:hypothetical protein
MKPSECFILIVFTALTFNLSAQDHEKTPKKLKPVEVQIQTGWYLEQERPGTVEEFKKLAPQSDLLNSDFTGFSQYGYSDYVSSPLFSILVGFQFIDKQKEKFRPNPLFRIGISYFSGYPLEYALSRRTSGIYDTLTSSQSGEIYIIDSINREYYFMDFSTKYLRFDGSVIYRTNPAARFSLFTGAGLTAGLSFNSETSVYYSNSTRLEARSSYTRDFYMNQYLGNRKSISESYSNKSQFGFSGYIPLGMDFRIGKKHPFWSNIHMFCEMRLGINVTFLKDVKTLVNNSMHNGLGLKFTW